MIVLRNKIKTLPWTKENVDKYKNPSNLLKHARTGEGIEGIILVSSGRNSLIGYIAWEGDYIVAFEVAQGERGKGYGEKLLSIALENGCKRLSVRKDNTAAINLYHKFGFKEGRDLGKIMIEMEKL